MKTNCLVKLLSGQSLKGPLIGLSIKDGNLSLDEKIFSCCQAEGNYFDEAAKVAVHCDLKSRYLMVKKLFNQYYTYWGNTFPLLPQDLNRGSVVDLGLLKRVSASKSPAGHIIRKKAEAGPSELWPLALTLAWRFGYACHFVCMGKTPANAILPDETSPVFRGRKTAIFVGRVAALTDPGAAFDFEALVANAYHGQRPLFVEFIEPVEMSAKAGAKAAPKPSFYAKKISALKARSPLSFLNDDCLSRLENMCGSLKF